MIVAFFRSRAADDPELMNAHTMNAAIILFEGGLRLAHIRTVLVATSNDAYNVLVCTLQANVMRHRRT